MKFKILTIFPEFFVHSLNFSLLKKAQERDLVQFEIHDLRTWSEPRTVHRQIDDRPYGGGPGMVMMVEPMYRALSELNNENEKLKVAKVIFSPKGQKYSQPLAEKLAAEFEELILIVPHYEGFDERILNFIDYELCIGDFVLTGGEIPALAVIDSVSRLLPGVVGNEESTKTESFSNLKSGERNIEHPHYTRPEVFVDNEGLSYPVPKVLLSGNHKEIEEWRRNNSK